MQTVLGQVCETHQVRPGDHLRNILFGSRQTAKHIYTSTNHNWHITKVLSFQWTPDKSDIFWYILILLVPCWSFHPQIQHRCEAPRETHPKQQLHMQQPAAPHPWSEESHLGWAISTIALLWLCNGFNTFSPEVWKEWFHKWLFPIQLGLLPPFPLIKCCFSALQ